MPIDRPSRLFTSAILRLFCLSLVLACIPAVGQEQETKEPLLTQDDIELIKVYEVQLKSDPAPRVTIPRDELRNFLKEFQDNDRIPRGKKQQSDWLREEGHKQLALLFELQARNYYKHVRIKSTVESLRQWSNIHRQYVHGYFQPLFGSGNVPGMQLIPRGRETERIEMTNFYVLTQASVDGKLLIDRYTPEESLLLQWGLPRESAKFPAPEIEGWQPQFKSLDDERFIEIVNWIKSLVASNQGKDYGIVYKMPVEKKPSN